VVVLDTVRRAAVDRPEVPAETVASLSEVGAGFERAVAPAPWTLPSHASMYTGRYPTEHGARHGNRWLTDAVTTLPERLSTAGFDTGLFTANVFLTESFNMARGYDTVEFIRGADNKLFADGLDPVEFINQRDADSGLARYREIVRAILDGPPGKNLANGLYFRLKTALDRGSPASTADWDRSAVDRAKAFITDSVDRGGRFFGFVNLVSGHGPWPFDRDRLNTIGVTPEDIAPERRWRAVAADSEAQWPYAAGEIEFNDTDRRILRMLYRSWVAHADELAGELVTQLERLGVADETLVVVTADHGEQIARDGVLGHELTVSESVARVPLAVRGPGVASEDVAAPVELRHLYGTVLERTGVDDSAPSLFDASVRGSAFIEAEPVDPDAVPERYRAVRPSDGVVRRVGRRYGDRWRAERAGGSPDTAPGAGGRPGPRRGDRRGANRRRSRRRPSRGAGVPVRRRRLHPPTAHDCSRADCRLSWVVA
jgi:arylsulfatase A-like enzyme